MFLKRVVHLVLVFLLLFADSGMTLYAHTCLKTKHTHYSIGTPKHCCKKAQSKSNCAVKKSSCCNVSSKYIKQYLVFKVTETMKQCLPVLSVSFTNIFFIPQLLKVTSVNVFSNPPPIYSKAEGIYTQTFRI